MKINALFSLVFLSLIACSAKQNSSSDETVNVGMLLSVQTMKEWSLYLERSAQLAVDEINAAGGIDGRPIKLIVESANSDVIAASATKLIDIDKVVAILGPASSMGTISVANSVVIPKNIPLITPTATSDDITSLSDNSCIWRTIPRNSMQAEVVAKYLIEKSGKKTGAVISLESSYGKNLSARFKTAFTDNGGTIVSEAVIPVLDDYTTYDFTEALDSVFEQQPETVFFALEMASLIFTTIANNQDKYLKNKPLLVGGDTLFTQQFLDNTPEIVNGMLVIVPGSRELGNFKTFSAAFQAAFSVPAETYPYLENMYDAMFVLGLAMIEGKATGSESIKSHLLTVSKSGEKISIRNFAKAKQLTEQGKDIDYEGTSGPVDFDEAGDIISSPFTIYEVQNKIFVKKDII